MSYRLYTPQSHFAFFLNPSCPLFFFFFFATDCAFVAGCRGGLQGEHQPLLSLHHRGLKPRFVPKARLYFFQASSVSVHLSLCCLLGAIDGCDFRPPLVLVLMSYVYNSSSIDSPLCSSATGGIFCVAVLDVDIRASTLRGQLVLWDIDIVGSSSSCATRPCVR